MLIVSIKRSNTKLPGYRKCFHDADAANEWIKLQCESLEEDGWEFEDTEGDDDNGLVKCKNQYEKFIMIISWRTLHS